jgi:protease I
MNPCLLLSVLLALVTVSASSCKETKSMSNLKGKKVAMVIAHNGFRDEEFARPFEYLTRAGAQVEVASSSRGTARGMLGATVTAPLLVSEVIASNVDAVIFVGGGGASEYFNNNDALALARAAAAGNKVVAAICIAPAILANAGLLKGRRATCYPTQAGALKRNGATVIEQGVVRDGRIVTADGPESAAEFARTVAEALE